MNNYNRNQELRRKRQKIRHCAKCGKWGFIGENLIEHTAENGKKIVLCPYCHNREQMIARWKA